jgi:hypothetical protein
MWTKLFSVVLWDGNLRNRYEDLETGVLRDLLLLHLFFKENGYDVLVTK